MSNDYTNQWLNCLSLGHIVYYLEILKRVSLKSTFGSCIYGYRDAFSIFFGYFSIFCWLNAHIPQIRENYKLKFADGLSIYLLWFWLAGDMGTLLGCFLNHQMLSQIILNCTFIASDAILIYQYFYYGKNTTTIDKKDSLTTTDDLGDNSNSSLKTSENNKPVTNYGSFATKTKSATTLMGLMLFGIPITSEKNSQFISMSTSGITFGLVLAWSCVSLDIASRFPQLFKNFKRHSVQGISETLFAFAMAGNFSYGASIALHPGRTENEFSEALPYIIGSSCTLFLDTLLFGQYIYYTKIQTKVNKITSSA